MCSQILREGWKVNHKRVYRRYREEGLNLRELKRRQKSTTRVPLTEMPNTLNECWAMDFVSDQMYNGKRFRILALIDLYSRECLALYADKNIWFMSLDDAKGKIQRWKNNYNELHPHSSLTNFTPADFARIHDILTVSNL